MSHHQCVFTIIFVVIIVCVLHGCVSKNLDIGPQKRYEEDYFCKESQKTVQQVAVCPQSDTGFKEQSNSKNCSRYSSCAGERLVYHCLSFGEMLVEVCAPRSVITGRCCPVYNYIFGRVIEDYNKPCSSCPFQYKSDESVNKKECLQPERKKITTTDMSGDDNLKLTEIVFIVLAGIAVCSCLAIAYLCRLRWTSVCTKHEDGLEVNKNKQDSLKLQYNNLVCHECSEETRLKEDDYESYRPSCDS